MKKESTLLGTLGVTNEFGVFAVKEDEVDGLFEIREVDKEKSGICLTLGEMVSLGELIKKKIAR